VTTTRPKWQISSSNDTITTSTTATSFTRISPIKDAQKSIENIISDLNSNVLPSTKDIETILIPGRLGLRRSVLVRILKDCFDLRGKCIPNYQYLEEKLRERGKNASGNGYYYYDDDIDDDVPMQFATHCPLQDLGEFVVSKINKEEERQKREEEQKQMEGRDEI